MTAVSAERGDLALLIVIAPVVHPLSDAPPEKTLGQKNKRVKLTTRGQRIKRVTSDFSGWCTYFCPNSQPGELEFISDSLQSI